jgi:hypothetical protein
MSSISARSRSPGSPLCAGKIVGVKQVQFFDRKHKPERISGGGTVGSGFC